MQNSPFNLIAAAAILQKKWKTIAVFIAVTLAAATVTLFCVPPYFCSKAILIPANTVLADKARLFNNQIQNLNSYFGNGDDIDRIYSIAVMDTTYQSMVDEFAMIGYYQLKDDSLPILRRKAVLRLRKDLSVQKTENDQVQIIAWTKDKQLSASLVNRMVDIIQQREADIWRNSYTRSSDALENAVTAMEGQYKQLADSLTASKPPIHDLLTLKMQTLLDQVKEYRKTADEFKLAIQSQPAVLYVMEKAVPAAKAERPDKPAVLLAAFILALLFGSLLVLINNRNNVA